MGNIAGAHHGNKYTVSDDGVIFKVEDDGSINKLAQIDNNGNIKIFSEQQLTSKRGRKGWYWFFIILFVITSSILGFLYIDADDRYTQLYYEQYEEQDSLISLIKRNDIPEKELAYLRSEYKKGETGMTVNGHEYVDLGLPSGLKWATCNVGANSPEETGNYYAWGETSPKSSYTESNSTTYNRSMGDIGGHFNYDVACSDWGGSWRLPTLSDFYELQNECEWIWSSYYGVFGYIVKSKHNGKQIFLPVTGYMDGEGLVSGGGYYWSSTPNSNKHTESFFLVFSEKDGCWCSSVTDSRYDGMSVRPVSE